MMFITFESLIYPICILFVIAYPIPWLMHICALVNALIKRDINLKSIKQLSRKINASDILSHQDHKQQSNLPSRDSHNDLSHEDRDKKSIVSRHCHQVIHGTQQASLLNDHATIHEPSDLISNNCTDINHNQEQIRNLNDEPNQNQALQQRQQPDDFFTCDLSDANGYSNMFTLPGVSILKPLIGVDPRLEENLETFFQMCYPRYELLFCVQDVDDAAVTLVQKLIQRFPHIDASLFIGGARVGVNPKINNMQPAYEAAKYELILISDSAISMKQNTLYDMVSDMKENVALVHQMPFVRSGRDGFHSIIEEVYFGTAHARAYLTADLLGINCPTGMSALMRKHLIDEVGGIKAFGQYLAEDFFFAKSFTDRGWDIAISRQPAWQNPSSGDSIWTLYSRIERWIKLRFAMVPHITILEPFSECILLGVVESSIHAYLWEFNPYTFFLIHIFTWLVFDYFLLCTILGGPLDMKLYEFVLAWLIRECSALFIFIKAISNPLVTWRSRVFRLKWGGIAEEVTSKCNNHEQKNKNQNQVQQPLHEVSLKPEEHQPNLIFSMN